MRAYCRRFIVHYASLTCNSTQPQHTLQSTYQSVLITGFKSLPGLPGVKGLIAAYIWCNPSSSNSHPDRICNFRILSFGSDSNADDRYRQLERFIVRDLTNWANENHIIHFNISWHSKLVINAALQCVYSGNLPNSVWFTSLGIRYNKVNMMGWMHGQTADEEAEKFENIKLVH